MTAVARPRLTDITDRLRQILQAAARNHRGYPAHEQWEHDRLIAEFDRTSDVTPEQVPPMPRHSSACPTARRPRPPTSSSYYAKDDNYRSSTASGCEGRKTDAQPAGQSVNRGRGRGPSRPRLVFSVSLPGWSCSPR